MERRKLIFFAASAPSSTSKAAWSAYHFALVGQGAGLDTEVRLAGDAVDVLKNAGDGPRGTTAMGARDLLSYMHDGVDKKLFVSA